MQFATSVLNRAATGGNRRPAIASAGKALPRGSGVIGARELGHSLPRNHYVSDLKCDCLRGIVTTYTSLPWSKKGFASRRHDLEQHVELDPQLHGEQFDGLLDSGAL